MLGTMPEAAPVARGARGGGRPVSAVLSEERVLPAEPRSALEARRLVRRLLEQAGAERFAEATELAVSELVTNAVVHAGGEVRLRVRCDPQAVRVEVDDTSSHRPVPRHWTTTSGTGRGLHLLTDCVDVWDVDMRPGAGKTVWFEIGGSHTRDPHDSAATADSATGVVEVELRGVPLLMHHAWQEHAAGLLREHLLLRLDEDLAALDEHAAASDALNLLHEQLPVPPLHDDGEAIMADAVEPAVSAERLVLRVPAASVAHFEVLSEALASALQHAREGRLLAPPTQPEIELMRVWLCGEVLGQAGGAAPTAWRSTGLDVGRPATPRLVGSAAVAAIVDAEPVIVTDERHDIVGVSPAVAAFLGYDDAAALVGRRVLAVVPARFHQAHVAGTTMHASHGRDVLLDRVVRVPMVRADGSEVEAAFEVTVQRLDADDRVFVARFLLD